MPNSSPLANPRYISQRQFMRYWSAIAALLLAVPAHAAESAHIAGTISDQNTHQPIAEASVVLRYRTLPAHLQTTTSSTNGEYRFDVESAGEYAIEAEAPGYAPSEYSPQQPFAKIEEDSTTEEVIPSSHTLDISLTRAARMVGRVKDGKAQTPIPGMALRLWQMNWRRGQRVFTENHIAFTGDDGSFRFDALAPGDYFLEMNSHISSYEVRSGPPHPVVYPTTFWPASDPDTGLPFTIRNSGEVDTGDLPISRISLARIRINTDALDCQPGSIITISLDRKFGWNSSAWRGGGEYVSCGESMTATNLSPGQYRIQAFIRAVPVTLIAPPTDGTFASASAHVEEGADIDVDLTGRGAIRISGVVNCQCAEGWRDRIVGTPVQLSPLAPGILMSAPENRVDSHGSFLVGGAFTGLALLSFQPAGFSVAKILYNGSDVGPAFTPDPYAASQSLRIVLSDRPSSVSGTVRKDLTPEPAAHVVLARWPLSLDVNGDPFSIRATAGNDGQFQIGALGPGIYRAVALDDAMWRDSDLPGILAGWLSSGQEFNLGEGEGKQITIQLTRP
jgi:Carboxypeptidase regulatory-like domain